MPPPTRCHVPRGPLAALLSALLGLAGCAGTATPSGTPAAVVDSIDPPQEVSQPFNELGRPDAPVAIIEFGDLQCPYCARHALNTLPELRRNFIEAGKVRYAARDLPLPMHRAAVPAAVAARCAGEQGRFWEYRARLMQARMRLDETTFDALAEEFGLDLGRFAACRSDGRHLAAVQADVALARAQGIASTPAFVIGRVAGGEFRGEILVGARSYEEFARRIEALLGEPR
jgi:protein-disulfide isomerase